MPQSEPLRQEFLSRYGPRLAARRARVRDHFRSDPNVVKDFFERLKAEKAATADAEGAAPLPTTDQVLPSAEALLQYVESGFQPVVDDLCDEIDRWLARRGIVLASETYVGALPTGLFNAQATVVPGGALMLVNTGLMMLLHQATKIVGWAMRFTEYGPQGELLPHRTAGRPTHSMAEIQEALTEVVIAYLANEDSTYATRHPALGGVRGAVAARLCYACELFVIAHEYGHVHGGHLSVGGRRLILPDAPTTPLATKSTNQEVEADRFAFELLLDASVGRVFADIAPVIFFALAELIDTARRDGLGVSALADADHPSPSKRIAHAREFFGNRLDDAFGLADPILGFIQFHTPVVVQGVRARRSDISSRLPTTEFVNPVS